MEELIAALPALISLVNIGVKAIQDSTAHSDEEKQLLITAATAELHAAHAAAAAVKFRDVDSPAPTPPA